MHVDVLCNVGSVPLVDVSESHSKQRAGRTQVCGTASGPVTSAFLKEAQWKVEKDQSRRTLCLPFTNDVGWADCFIPLSLSFLIYKLGTIITLAVTPNDV